MSKSYIPAELRRFVTQRSHQWGEHFQFQRGEIVPLTEIGRVTVRLLQFNRSERIAARRLLEEAGVWEVKRSG